jgi:hypothetical protein
MTVGGAGIRLRKLYGAGTLREDAWAHQAGVIMGARGGLACVGSGVAMLVVAVACTGAVEAATGCTGEAARGVGVWGRMRKGVAARVLAAGVDTLGGGAAVGGRVF